MKTELAEMTTKDLQLVMDHVTKHRQTATVLEDQQAVINADWLIHQIELEIRKRQRSASYQTVA